MKKTTVITALSMLAVVFLLHGWISASAPGGKKIDERSVFVEKVADGDSVEAVLGGRRVQIRLIGIDAPELGQRPWGKKAKKYLEDLIAASGWEVGLEYDVEKYDKYGRLLAYLRTRDGKLVNEELLRAGLAVIFTFPPNVKYTDRFRTAQIIARENKAGIWGKAGLRQLPSDYRKEHPRD
ncbi:MAG TPA: thermonuclease family protein [Thermodesulfovibrionales bacterium]|nr:thermonuclease family protein [Thermodesulfovibrionales bacterium]